MQAEIIIVPEEDGRALGDVLRQRGFSRRLVLRLKRTEGGMTRSGTLIRTIDRVAAGDVIVISEQQRQSLVPNAALAVPVLYEDESIIVFDKPPFMPVHPSAGHYDDTLGNFFSAHCPGTTFRPVNRLDRNTSGCVLAAKTQFAASALQGRVSKRYLAVCCGVPDTGGVIDAPIAREEGSIIKRCVSKDGKPSVTRYSIIASGGGCALCEVTPLTGRTHQIRVHFAHIGCPLAGDDMYGGSTEHISRHALHCTELRFCLPDSGEEKIISSQMPQDMALLLRMT